MYSTAVKQTMIFDPILISCQIISLQCFFYIVIGIILGMCKIFLNTPFNLDLIFASSKLSVSSDHGFLVSCTFILGGLIGYGTVQYE